MKESRPIVIEYYQTENGDLPFLEWFESLQMKEQRKVLQRLDRIQLGNEGDWKSIDGPLMEYRIHGLALRIYAARTKDDNRLVLLGGGKPTQKKDIKRAKAYLEDYLKSKH